MSTRSTAWCEGPGWYEIRLQGRLDERWATWFEGMTLVPGPDATTVLTGYVADQSALHGLLARLRDLGLPLLSVVGTDPAESPDSNADPR